MRHSTELIGFRRTLIVIYGQYDSQPVYYVPKALPLFSGAICPLELGKGRWAISKTSTTVMILDLKISVTSISKHM
jgi:hypothetical protein